MSPKFEFARPARVLRGGRLLLGVIVSVVLAGSPATAGAQTADGLAPGAPGWCSACTRPTDPPWLPPVDPPPTDEPSDGSPSGRTGWAAIGAAGLALAAGIPLGSALQPTLPFRPVVAEAPAPGELSPAPQISEAPGVVLPSQAVPLPVQQEATGVLAPDTASHLPLLLAIGIAAIAGGVALLRDHRRRRRRRGVLRVRS